MTSFSYHKQIFVIPGSADFFGYNMYTSVYVTYKVRPLTPANYHTDQDVEESRDPDWDRCE